MKISKSTWAEIARIVISAIVGALSAFGVSSCTVNSGNRENLEQRPQYYPYHVLRNENYNNSPVRKTDTIKVIKESNTIYTND